MSERTAKLLALTATVMGLSVIVYRSVKNKQPFNTAGLVGVALWGGGTMILASFAPDIAAVLAGLLAADVAVLPQPGSSGSTFAELLGTLIAPGQTQLLNAQTAQPGQSVPSHPKGVYAQ